MHLCLFDHVQDKDESCAKAYSPNQIYSDIKLSKLKCTSNKLK